MNLLIDLGNSRVKWAWADNITLRECGSRDYTGSRGAADALGHSVAMAVQPERVAVASVAGCYVTEAVAQWSQTRFDTQPLMVRAQSAAFGIINAYTQPQRLGADRWAALIGAYRRTQAPVCVVDCGTAITIDVLGGGGRHHGGLIAPGFQTMRRALYGATAGIPDEGQGRPTPPAVDTRSAVTAGTLYAAAAFVDRAHSELEREYGEPLPCLITGGEMDALRPLLQMRTEPAPHLVLEGLAIAALEAA